MSSENGSRQIRRLTRATLRRSGQRDAEVEIDLMAPVTDNDRRVLATLGFTLDDVVKLERQLALPDEQMVGSAMRVLDLVLEPDDAESAIANLTEAYERRRHDLSHAKRWLFAQIGWIVFNRLIDIVSKVASAARAGK